MVENPIDELSIKITSDIKSASDSIEKLKSTLSNLKDAYNQTGKGGNDVGNSLKGLSDGVKQMSGVDSSKITDVASALKTLSKKSMEEFTRGIQSIDNQTISNLIGLSNAFSTLANAPDISGAVSGIKKLSKVDFIWLSANVGGMNQTVFDNLTNLAIAMEMLAGVPNIENVIKIVGRFTTLPFDKLATNVSAIDSSVIGKIHMFAEALGEFGKVDYFDGIAGAVKATQRIASIDFKAFSQNVGNIDEGAAMKLKKLMDVFKQMSGETDIADAIVQMESFFSRDYSGFLNFVQTASAGLPALADGLKQLASAGASPEFVAAIDKLASVSGMDFQGMVTASASMATSSNTVVPDTSAEIDRETEETEQSGNKFINALKKIRDEIKNTSLTSIFPEAKQTFASMFTGLKSVGTSVFDTVKKGFQGLGDAAKKAVKPITNFVNSIGRILKYRAIRFVLSEISKAIKEGTNNMYQYSKAVGGDFAKSMDALATSALYFKNSIGAMLAPIINAITPAIDKAVDKIVEFNNVINETIAKLTGASTWTRAIKIPKEYAESASKATKDTTKGLKEAKETLKDFQMGFDELNVISQDAFDGLDISGLEDKAKEEEGIDYTIMFEDVAVDIDPLLDAFRKALEDADFYEAGRLLGLKVKEMFASLPYEEWAETFANAINNAVAFATGFLETKPFDELGAGIAAFVNKAFEDIDFYGIGRMIAALINSISSGLHELVTNLNFEQIGKKFGDLFNGFTDFIDFDTIVTDISVGLNGILNSVSAFLENSDFKEFGQKLGESLNNFDVEATLGNAGRLIKAALDGIADAVNGFLTGVDWGKLGADLFKGLSDFLFGNDWDETGAKIVLAFNNITKAIVDFISGFAGEAVLNLFDDEQLDTWIVGAEAYTDAINKARDAFVGWAEYVNESGGIFQTYIDYWSELGGKVYEFFNKSNEEMDSNKEETKSWMDEEKFTLERAWKFLESWGADCYETNAETFNNIKDSISTTLDYAQHDIAEFGVKFVNKVETMKTGVKNKFAEMKTGIVNVFNGIKTSISESLDNMYDKIAEWDGFDKFVSYVASIPEKVKEHADNIKNSIVDSLSSLPDAIKGIVNTGIGYVEGLVNRIIDGFNSIVGVFNKSFKWASKILGDDVFGTENKETTHITLPRFEKGGIPDAASLFFANENGVAEMVGQIGNRTAVANNDQIVDAVSDGVSVAVSYVMAEYVPQIINAIMQGKTIEIDGKALAKSVNEANRTIGFQVYSGGVV